MKQGCNQLLLETLENSIDSIKEIMKEASKARNDELFNEASIIASYLQRQWEKESKETWNDFSRDELESKGV